MPSVAIIGPNFEVQDMFRRAGWRIERSIGKSDLLCFTGGEDVSPDLYGEPAHPTTHCNPRRDHLEKEIFKQAVYMGIPCVGICRGGQLLNVMHGGRMWQHVAGHGIYGTHQLFLVDDDDKRYWNVTSTHHQMMRPAEHGEVLAKANFVNKVEDGHRTVCNIQGIEVVLYNHPTSPALCFQPHPEFTGADETMELFFYLINKYLIKAGE